VFPGSLGGPDTFADTPVGGNARRPLRTPPHRLRRPEAGQRLEALTVRQGTTDSAAKPRRYARRWDPGDGALFQRGDGRWVARLRMPDGKWRWFYGKTKVAANKGTGTMRLG